MRWQYLGTILQRLNLDHPVRDGVRYHRCRTCGSEWPSESVFKNFVTREGLGVRSGYETPKTIPNRPDRSRMGIA